MNNEKIKITPIKMDNGIDFRGSVTMSNEEVEKRVNFMEEHMKDFNNLVIKAENELYIKELLKRNELLRKENQQLKENYDRIYNENCKLREEHNITDISLLDENHQLKKEKSSLMTALNTSREKYNNDKVRYRRKYKNLKKQKDDVVEYIKEECLGKNLVDDDVRNDTFKDLLRMLGEIDG